MIRIEMRHFRAGRLIHDSKYHNWGKFTMMLNKRKRKMRQLDRIDITITDS